MMTGDHSPRLVGVTRVLDPLEIKQGTTRVVTLRNLRDSTGSLLDPTGWGIRGVARPGIWADVVAVWTDTPADGEYLAEVVDADPDLDQTVVPGEKWIDLHIDPDVSLTWTAWFVALLDVSITEPGTDRKETFSTELRVVPTTVRA
jgi:hypothetical protein